MNLETRIRRAEARAAVKSIDAARVRAMAERGEYDLLTNAELHWLCAGGAPLSAETSAELDRLFESLSDADLRAILETRTLSPEGQAIMTRIDELMGDAK